MPQAFKYPVKPLLLSDYIIASDSSEDNVTRNFSVSGIIDAIRGSMGIATVTSISTANSRFIDLTSTPSPITSVGDITAVLSATDLPAVAVRSLYFLRGDGKWILPGPEPTEITGFNGGVVLTTNLNSINFVGNVQVIGDTTGFLELNFPGTAALVDSIDAGSGIGVVTTAGSAVISNTGALQVVAGGNVTVSGGTGTVTVSSAKNPGTVTAINSGLGIAPITNNTSNPRINIQYTSVSNYIADNLTNTVISLNDTVNYNQIGPSNVKSTRLRDIPHDALALIKTYVDNNDSSKIKNDTDVGYDTTATVDQIVTLAIAEYQALAIKDPSTLYLIVGPGASFTQNLVISSVSGIVNSNGTVSSGYNLLNPDGSQYNVFDQSVTGVVGTPFSFEIGIVPVGLPGTTITNKSGFGPITGAIASGGGTTNMTLAATINPPIPNSGRIQLNIDTTQSLGINNNLSSLPNVWQLTMPAGQGSLPGNAFFPYDQTPPQFLENIGTYYFGPNIEITNNAYEIVNIVYSQQINGSRKSYFDTWAAGQETPTTVDETIPVTHYISAELQLKGGAQSLFLHDSVVVELADGSASPKPDNIYTTSVTSFLPNTGSTIIRPSITGSSNGYNTTVGGPIGTNWQWGNPVTTISDSRYAFSAANPLTHTFDSPPNGQTGTFTASGTSTMTTGGTLIFTPDVSLVNLSVNFEDSLIYSTGVSTPDQNDFTLQVKKNNAFLTVPFWDQSAGNSAPIEIITGATPGDPFPFRIAQPIIPTTTGTANATPLPGFEFFPFDLFLAYFKSVLPAVVPIVDTTYTIDLIGTLRPVPGINPPWSVSVTGDSIGQGVAYLVTMFYTDNTGFKPATQSPGAIIAGGSVGNPTSNTVTGVFSRMQVIGADAGEATIQVVRVGQTQTDTTQNNFRIKVTLFDDSNGSSRIIPTTRSGSAGTVIGGSNFAWFVNNGGGANKGLLDNNMRLVVEIIERQFP